MTIFQQMAIKCFEKGRSSSSIVCARSPCWLVRGLWLWISSAASICSQIPQVSPFQVPCHSILPPPSPPTLGLPLRFSLPNCRNQVKINSHGEGTQLEEAIRRAHLSSPPELGGPSPFLDSFHFWPLLFLVSWANTPSCLSSRDCHTFLELKDLSLLSPSLLCSTVALASDCTGEGGSLNVYALLLGLGIQMSWRRFADGKRRCQLLSLGLCYFT